MASSTITKECQTAVPEEVREKLQIGPNDVLHWEVLDDSVRVTATSLPLPENQTTPAPDFSKWLGWGKRAPTNPAPKFRSDSDLWS
jgi:hypothetical protein